MTIDGVPASSLSFGTYLDRLLTTAHELFTPAHGREIDLGEMGSDGYALPFIEFIGLVVGGGWVFFALLNQPNCPACGSYLRTLAKKDDGFGSDEELFAYYDAEFAHPVDSPEFAEQVRRRHVPSGGPTRIKLATYVRAWPTCGTQSVDEQARTFTGRAWEEALHLSRVVDLPPGGRCRPHLPPLTPAGSQPELSHMQHAPIGIQHALMHHFAQRRMREDGFHQLGLRRLQLPRDGVALDEFGDFRADHMGAQ